MIYVEKEKKKQRSYAEKIVTRKVIKHILPVFLQNIYSLQPHASSNLVDVLLVSSNYIQLYMMCSYFLI